MRAVENTHGIPKGGVVFWLVGLADRNLKWKIISALVWMRCSHEIKKIGYCS